MRSIYYLLSGIAIIGIMLILNQFIEIPDFFRGLCVGLGFSLGIFGLVASVKEAITVKEAVIETSKKNRKISKTKKDK